MSDVDKYIENVIKKGNEGSALLNALCASTLKNSKYVDVLKHGKKQIAVVRVPDGYNVTVHSIGGYPEEKDLAAHSASLVDRLVEQAEAIPAKPIAFANVIDSSTGETSMLKTVANAMVQQANKYGLSIMNGENAILGPRVNCEANVSGTMISISQGYKGAAKLPVMVNGGKERHSFAFFNPEGKAVFINSDGVGTKTEFYERAERYELAILDFMAMNLDDASKLGAIAQVLSGVVETKGDIPFEFIEDYTSDVASKMGILGILNQENVGNRLRGYNDEVFSYNISGSVVSTIDEERLKNPLTPSVGESLIAIVGKLNPRSNGITSLREIMVDNFGLDWHKKKKGHEFLPYLAEPSTVLYPVFQELIDKGLATSVYHMSGGAYNGKLARPLAEHNLFVKIEDLFPPHEKTIKLAEMSNTSAEVAYGKWPMGNDGFISTKNPKKAIEVIEKHGLKGREVGQLKHVDEVNGKTGVELLGFDGELVYYSGK